MSDRQSIEHLIESKSLDETQREKFKRVLEMRDFATRELLLPDNKSYTSYVDVKRDNVSFAVFATPELSLRPKTWCFWIVGCVPYRGYFEQSKAEQFAQQLIDQQLDVYIAPIPAYSTLGWFSDPVLSTMLNRGERVAAEYIFHELAHQKMYIENDAEFNEAFATALARIGVLRWMESENKSEEKQQYLKSIQQKQQLYPLINQLREQLTRIYALSASREEKLRQKQAAFLHYKQTVETKISHWPHAQVYRQWLLKDLNNAKLNAFSTYQAQVPDFMALFENCEVKLIDFYRVVEASKKLNKQQRTDFLQNHQCVLAENGQD